MKQDNRLLEKMVLAEIEGKNRAIHTYDSIVWKIRTGFLTLIFAGWAILLRGIVEGKAESSNLILKLLWGMALFSCGLAYAAWIMDCNYTRRKFRLILAFDRLMDQVRICHSDLLKIPAGLLKVAGDKGELPYDCRGYRDAMMAARLVYTIPLVIVVIVILLGCV